MVGYYGTDWVQCFTTATHQFQPSLVSPIKWNPQHILS